MKFNIFTLNISETVSIKMLLSALLASLTTFYFPVKAFIMPVLWLAFLDIVTGLYVARQIEMKEITSRQFFRKLPQLLMFLLAITASMHADPFFVHMGLEQFKTTKWVISFYGIYELFSILENLGKSGMPVAKGLSIFLRSKLPEQVKETLPEQ